MRRLDAFTSYVDQVHSQKAESVKMKIALDRDSQFITVPKMLE